ncbi:MAG: electron transfer flavoprotein subunit alpha [Desulfobulbus propionicus]|nr:MAG: electron transfer flavoprotein subunit alpha [Desulfobulbus propionicus]
MLTIDCDKCVVCGVCESSCPFGAINIENDCAVVNESCTLCGSCIETCPVEALSITVVKKERAKDLTAWSGVMVFGEFRHGVIAPVTFELLGIGRKLADARCTRLSVIMLGDDVRRHCSSLIAAGADVVYLVEGKELRDFREDVFAAVLEEAIRSKKPEIVLAGATAIGRSVIPFVATAVGAGLTADCTRLGIRESDGMLLQTRPAFGGNIMATIECPETRPQMATVRPHVMPASIPDESRQGEVEEITVAAEVLVSKIEVLDTVTSDEDFVNIQEAEILVAGGRGLESEKGFELIRELADELGAAVAASRAAVDAGWIPYHHQVGQTGKTVGPKVYVACGISGAVQHAVGMQSADTIIAINRDKNAPIFDLCTFGVVGDLYEVIPALIKEIQEVKRGN